MDGAAALILTTLRLLAMYGKPLNVGIAHGSVLSAIADQIGRMPLRIVQLVAIAIVMIGFAGNLRRSIILVIGALLVWFVGVQLVLWAAALFREPRSIYGVMADPLELRLPYQAGTIFAATVVFCFARLTGLAFRNASANG